MIERHRRQVERFMIFRPALVALLFLSLALLIVIADRAPLHLDRRNPVPSVASDFYRHYRSVLDGSIGGPYAYRLLVPYVTAWIHDLFPGVDEIDIDAALKVLLLFSVQMFFFRAQRRIFPPWTALAAVFWMDALLGYSLAYVLGPASGETTDMLNLLVFIIALDMMGEGGLIPMGILFLLGMLNRETPLLLLPLVYALDRAAGRGAKRAAVLSTVAIGAYAALRLAVHAQGGGWFTLEGIGANIPGLAPGMDARAVSSVLHVLLLLAPLFACAVPGFRRKTLLFRGSILLAALLVAVHFIVATVIESRLWMPIFPLLIPPSLETLSRAFTPEADGPPPGGA